MRILTGREYGKDLCDQVSEALLDARVGLAEQSDFTLPKRSPRSHKYSYGRALIIGGSLQYSGAPTLAANA